MPRPGRSETSQGQLPAHNRPAVSTREHQCGGQPNHCPPAHRRDLGARAPPGLTRRAEKPKAPPGSPAGLPQPWWLRPLTGPSRVAAGLRSTTFRCVSSLGLRPTLDLPRSDAPRSPSAESPATHLTSRSTSVPPQEPPETLIRYRSSASLTVRKDIAHCSAGPECPLCDPSCLPVLISIRPGEQGQALPAIGLRMPGPLAEARSIVRCCSPERAERHGRPAAVST
jgi:hypothetical protein